MKVAKHPSPFVDLASAPKAKLMVGVETRILTGLDGEKMMMVLTEVLPNHEVPLHSHLHEQIGMVQSGKALFKIGAEERIVKKGDFYCIPASVSHHVRCLGHTSFVVLEVFCPIREDYLQKIKTS